MTSVALLVALLMTALPAAAQTAAPVPAGEPVVVVTGEGVIKATPDQAWVTFAVESRSKNPKEAQTQNAKAMSTVQERLRSAGIARDVMRTLSYDLQLEADWVNGRQVPRGYVARNALQVRVDDLPRLGEVIDLAITSGANSVSDVRFDLKERETLERQALTRATADARARAEAAATGAGGALGRVLRIEEPTRVSYPSPPMPMMRQAMADAREAATPIAAGEIEVRATVVLTVALK